MRNLHEVEQELAEAVASHHELKSSGRGTIGQIGEAKEKIRALRAEAQDILTDGAVICPNCGSRPIGINQPTYYELRCISVGCHNPEFPQSPRKARGFSIGEAVYHWNNQAYFISPKGPVIRSSAEMDRLMARKRPHGVDKPASLGDRIRSWLRGS